MKTLKLSELTNAGILEKDIIDYAREVKFWAEQQKKVKETENETDTEKRFVSYPHPIVHPLIRDAVNKDGVAEYQIINDTIQESKSVVSLDEKKANLIHFVRVKEQEARLALMPLGKDRLISMHEKRITDSDNKIQQAIYASWMAEGKQFTVSDLEAAIEKTRDPEDTTFLKELSAIKEKIEALSWWAAEQESTIADLTEKNIDQWKMPTIDK